MTKAIIGTIVALLVVGGGIFLATNSGDKTDNTSSNSSQTDVADSNTDKTFTAANVAEHKTKDDCWTIVSGKVYDISAYVPNHPGGDEILRACGTDGTSLFTQRQTNSGEKVGSGTPHSDMAARQLERYLIGTLAAQGN